MHVTSSERIALTVAPDSLQLAPGSQVTIVVSATNQGSIVDQFGLLVEGLDPSWFTIRQGLVNLFPGATGNLDLDIHLPEGTAALAGSHTALLRIVSHEAPADTAVIDLPIEVIAIGGLAASLTPQRRRIGRRGLGRFVLELTNSGNADTLADLTVRDPEEALEVHLTPDRLSVPRGGAAQAELALRPRHRPLVSLERAYSFMVDVTHPLAATDAGTQATETVAMVAGELVFRPPLATLAALPLTARRLLMALAALALAAALLIWFLAAPGRRGALIERVPPAKPAVAAVEAAFDLPQKVASGPAEVAGAGGAAQGPQIKKFVLATPGQDGRTDYALLWQVEGADRVKISGADQPNAVSGILPLPKLDSTEFVLEASKDGVTVNQTVGIVIIRPPDIQEFVATPDTLPNGQSATLRWKAARGERATIGDQTVDPAGGSLTVSPAATTTYTLAVENELGRIERNVQVRVADATAASRP